MKHIFIAILIALQGETFAQSLRFYPQTLPPPNYSYFSCWLTQVTRTSDNGYIFGASPFFPNLHSADPSDHITIKTNSLTTPQWKQSQFAKALPLPSGRMIFLTRSPNDDVFPDQPPTMGQIAKVSNSGQYLWTASLSPTSFTLNHWPVLTDAVTYGNKVLAVGYDIWYDPINPLSNYGYNGILIEMDTMGTVTNQKVSAQTSTASSGDCTFEKIARTPQGSFILGDMAGRNIHKMDASFNLQWTYNFAPRTMQLVDVQTLGTGEHLCLLQNYYYFQGDTNSILLKLSPTGSLIFAKQIHIYATYGGMERASSGKFIITGVVRPKTSSDTMRSVIMMVDSNANVLWARKQMPSLVAGKALVEGNKVMYTSFKHKIILSNGDVNGNFSCYSKPITVQTSTVAMSSVFSNVMLWQGGVNKIAGKTYTNTGQAYADTCYNNVSVFENEIDQIKVWPNPGTGIINIERPLQEGTITIEILNPEGRLLENVSVSDNKVDLSQYSAGMYFIRINPAGANSRTIKYMYMGQ